VLLTGEAGIGKSRLVAEARRLASELGFTVVQGNGYEQDRALPYAPLLDLQSKLEQPGSPSPAGRRIQT